MRPPLAARSIGDGCDPNACPICRQSIPDTVAPCSICGAKGLQDCRDRAGLLRMMGPHEERDPWPLTHEERQERYAYHLEIRRELDSQNPLLLRLRYHPLLMSLNRVQTLAIGIVLGVALHGLWGLVLSGGF